jgi:acetoin utilization deacetylase AcuC-like enzyme
MRGMSGTAIVYSPRCIEHVTGEGHPERPDRLLTIAHRLRQSSLPPSVEWIEPAAIDLSLVARLHAADYIDRFRRACETNEPWIDTSDCPICPASFEIARISAGGAVAAVDAVMGGHANAFCATRPPGHHAERDRAMGFCFFNNVAIATEHLRHQHGLKRIAIIDWDVHHGNGTQHLFDNDPDIFFCSIHEDPRTMYPGTGYSSERGVGAGEGATLNVPMIAHSGDNDYKAAFESKILPAVDAFKPEFLLISAGFDAHRKDPLAHMRLSTEIFGWMTQQVMELAAKHCAGRLLSVLEGGYNLIALADSVELHVKELTHA